MTRVGNALHKRVAGRRSPQHNEAHHATNPSPSPVTYPSRARHVSARAISRIFTSLFSYFPITSVPKSVNNYIISRLTLFLYSAAHSAYTLPFNGSPRDRDWFSAPATLLTAEQRLVLCLVRLTWPVRRLHNTAFRLISHYHTSSQSSGLSLHRFQFSSSRHLFPSSRYFFLSISPSAIRYSDGKVTGKCEKYLPHFSQLRLSGNVYADILSSVYTQSTWLRHPTT